MLKTAVIPMAGYGTRLYPLTKAIPKAFLPVIGADGLARPAILHSVDEALSTGAERVIIVTSPASGTPAAPMALSAAVNTMRA